MFLTPPQKRAVKLLNSSVGFFYGGCVSSARKESWHDGNNFRWTDVAMGPDKFWAYDKDKTVYKKQHPCGHEVMHIDTISFQTAGELINKGVAALTVTIKNQWITLGLTDLGKTVAIQLESQ